MKPLDSTAFVAQLAQFGTVSGVQNMQTSLSSLATALQSSQMLTGTSLVGHRVLSQTDTAKYTGAAVAGQLTVPDGAEKVTVTVSDAAGQAVRHLALDVSAGTKAFTWDGRADDGTQLAPGTYKFEAVSTSGPSNTSIPTEFFGTVRSVSLDAAGSGLTVNTAELGAIGLASVREVI
jgi:flagellar basal-body rod modification protein FlgD